VVFKIESNINKEISEIKEKLKEFDQRISELEKIFQNEKYEKIKKKISIKEFLLSVKPRNDVQKTLAIGYYLEKFENFLSFNIKDLEKGFKLAKEKIPNNINYKVYRNISQGYMMERDKKKDNLKAWTLTRSGEEFVESKFQKKTLKLSNQ